MYVCYVLVQYAAICHYRQLCVWAWSSPGQEIQTHTQLTIVVNAYLGSRLGFRLEEGILSGRHHALPTP